MKKTIGSALAAPLALACLACVSHQTVHGADGPALHITAHLDAPRWAVLERQLLAENVPACREFFKKQW